MTDTQKTQDRVPGKWIVKNQKVGFLGDPRSTDGVYTYLEVNGERVLGRGESHYQFQPRTTPHVDGRWNRRCECLILKPTTAEKGVPKVRYHIVEDLGEFKRLDHIQTDDNRAAYRWLRTGRICFLGFDLDDLCDLEDRPVIVANNHTVASHLIGDPIFIELFTGLDEETPIDSTIFRTGRIQWVKMDERSGQIGRAADPDKADSYDELWPWEILSLEKSVVDEVAIRAAYEARLGWLTVNFSEEALAPFQVTLGDQRYKQALRAFNHNVRKLDLALSIGLLRAKRAKITKQASAVGAAALFGRQTALPATTSSPKPRRALPERGVTIEERKLSGVEQLEVWRTKWVVTLRTDILEPSEGQPTVNQIEEWAGNLRSVCLCEPADLNRDDMVVRTQFARAELPEEVAEALLRYVRIELQGADVIDYPAPGTETALAQVLPGAVVDGNAHEAWLEKLQLERISDRRIRLRLAASLAHRFDNNLPSEVRTVYGQDEIGQRVEQAYAAISQPLGPQVKAKLVGAI